MIKKIKMSELSEFDPSKYLDDDEALRFSSSGMKDCQYSHRERHWIPAFAGMTIFRPTAFQTSSRRKPGSSVFVLFTGTRLLVGKSVI
ncbi:hypothetical protein MCEGEM3_01770 [Oxalobacteraceae bacterium]